VRRWKTPEGKMTLGRLRSRWRKLTWIEFYWLRIKAQSGKRGKIGNFIKKETKKGIY
jgi:hypothetical protein